ncbi:hypothetical protein PHMEG_00022072 [Phytophthora megakarya]|uniref:Uncharacterized protein n=1 Tax=Phytophthora megakarya TaxID=4795 RepID=A0A225VK36_9STRA|nr:hypothetical protein PHMEG_00022072 [Phytophthora megakarya]
MPGEIHLKGKGIASTKLLLDCGATTIYVSNRWAEENNVQSIKLEGKTIQEKLRGNNIDWRGRRIEGTILTKTRRWERTGETWGPISSEGRPVIASGFRRSIEAKHLSAKRPDSCRGVALETDLTSAVKPIHVLKQKETLNVACDLLDDGSAGKSLVSDGEVPLPECDGTAEEVRDRNGTGGKDTHDENMLMMGVTDEAGVKIKLITRKQLRKFVKFKTNSTDESDFMIEQDNHKRRSFIAAA